MDIQELAKDKPDFAAKNQTKIRKDNPQNCEQATRKGSE